MLAGKQANVITKIDLGVDSVRGKQDPEVQIQRTDQNATNYLPYNTSQVAVAFVVPRPAAFVSKLKWRDAVSGLYGDLAES
jgi:hypothetical protein